MWLCFSSSVNLILSWEYLANNTKSLRSSFSEKNSCSNLQVLRSVHESELDKTCISRSHQVLVHFQNLCTLSYNTTVDNCLVVWLDRSSMMQDLDFSLKVLYTDWLNFLIKQNHSFSEVLPLKLIFLYHAFDRKAYRLSSNCLFNWQHLMVDCLNHDWLKHSVLVGSKVKDCIGYDSS